MEGEFLSFEEQMEFLSGVSGPLQRGGDVRPGSGSR